MKSENVTHRLSDFIRAKKVTVYAFEMAIGAGKNVLQKSLKNKTGFNISILEKVGAKYPDLNMDWLIHGRGSMLITGEGVAAAPAPAGVTLTSGCDEWQYKYYQLLEKYNDCLENRVGIMAKGVVKDVM